MPFFLFKIFYKDNYIIVQSFFQLNNLLGSSSQKRAGLVWMRVMLSPSRARNQSGPMIFTFGPVIAGDVYILSTVTSLVSVLHTMALSESSCDGASSFCYYFVPASCHDSFISAISPLPHCINFPFILLLTSLFPFWVLEIGIYSGEDECWMFDSCCITLFYRKF